MFKNNYVAIINLTHNRTCECEIGEITVDEKSRRILNIHFQSKFY